MFKIESISINNFKNIVDTEIPLGDFNVVVGPNNSGKSNLLQVIPFLRWLINGDVKEVENGLRTGKMPELLQAVKNHSVADEPLTIRVSFSNTETKHVFVYQIEIK